MPCRASSRQERGPRSVEISGKRFSSGTRTSRRTSSDVIDARNDIFLCISGASKPSMPEARYGSCASLGPDGRLWISHGFTQDDGRFADTRAYDFATGQWTDMTPAGDGPIKRCLHDCFWSSDGQRLILYGGQTTGVAALDDIWAYDLASSAGRPGLSLLLRRVSSMPWQS